MSARHDQKGGSTVSNIFWLLALAAFAFACWNFIPAYYAHYQLQDRALEFCRLYPQGNPDDQIVQKVMREVRDLSLDPYIYPANIKITTRDGSRRILISYTREIQIVPGYKYKWDRPIDVDAPFY